MDINTQESFGIFAATGVSNNAGFSEIHDLDVGISPGVRTSVTGFPPAIVKNGAIFASDDISPLRVPAMLTQSKSDLTAAYLFAEGATSPAPATVEGDQEGKTLAPGIYKSNSTLLIQNGDLTLDAQGNPNAVWIFQVASGEGTKMAESIKQYLVATWGIASFRIGTEGIITPRKPAKNLGSNTELDLLIDGDCRVSIESSSPALLKEFKGGLDHPGSWVAPEES